MYFIGSVGVALGVAVIIVEVVGPQLEVKLWRTLSSFICRGDSFLWS